MKIAVVANSAWYLYNFRRSLMRALRDGGHHPVAISPRDEYASRLTQEGFEWFELALDAAGTNPARELMTVLALRQMLRQLGVEAAFTYTPKANIYCGLAARGLRLMHVPNVSGLGRLFIDPGVLTFVVKALYRLAFGRATAVVFQNEDDRQVFHRAGLVKPSRSVRVAGSGVDLDLFAPAPLPPTLPAPIFLFVGRVLRDKGVTELVAAAKEVKQRHPDVRFQLLGSVGANNPTAVPAAEVQAWVDAGVVEILGAVDDVRPHIRQAHCVVLPSYREGVPRVLLEAAAMGRPCIATDVPGCRDAVVDGQTGYLCAARDVPSLVSALIRFIDVDPRAWQEMGQAGRRFVEEHFDERAVIETYLALARSTRQ